MKKTSSCFDCFDPGCFIKLCSSEWIEQIETHKTEVSYKKGQAVFTAGEFVNGLFFVKDGQIKIVSNGLHDKEQIVRLATSGHILGHRGTNGETYPISAVAMKDSVVCFVKNETISEAFLKNPNFTVKLMLFYSQELRGIEARIKYLAQMTVREKVAFALLYLKNIFGYEDQDHLLNITISRTDIAGICGTNEEQVIRNLSDFEKEKLIAKEGKKIRILNEPALSGVLEMYNLHL
jgi:CRP-like cAMP-binding protein